MLIKKNMLQNKDTIDILLIISGVDLLLNLFFHLVDFKRYCYNEILCTVDDVHCHVRELRATVHRSQRELHTFITEQKQTKQTKEGNEGREIKSKQYRRCSETSINSNG